MTNTEIIYNAAIAHGIPQEQLDACLQRGDLPFHTAADWSKRGYQVQKDAARSLTATSGSTPTSPAPRPSRPPRTQARRPRSSPRTSTKNFPTSTAPPRWSGPPPRRTLQH